MPKPKKKTSAPPVDQPSKPFEIVSLVSKRGKNGNVPAEPDSGKENAILLGEATPKAIESLAEPIDSPARPSADNATVETGKLSTPNTENVTAPAIENRTATLPDATEGKVESDGASARITDDENPADTTPTPATDGGEVSSDEPAKSVDKRIFQALGTLRVPVKRDETNKFYIEFGGKRFDLYILRDRFRAWITEYEKNPDRILYLRVYPKCRLVPKQDPVINFELVGWNEKNLFPENSGIFLFRGVWQFVPQFRSPVVTVYRNKGAIDPFEKFKASHLPVMMRREDGVNPFRFNPKTPKEELPPRYFVQALFKFIPSRNCWGWVEDLEPPTVEIPRYKKPVKAIPVGGQPGASPGKKAGEKRDPEDPARPAVLDGRERPNPERKARERESLPLSE